MRGRAASKQAFPSDGKEVDQGFHSCDILDFSFLVSLRVKLASLLELLTPCHVLLTINSLQ
jgi:hypothetical protein